MEQKHVRHFPRMRSDQDNATRVDYHTSANTIWRCGGQTKTGVVGARPVSMQQRSFQSCTQCRWLLHHTGGPVMRPSGLLCEPSRPGGRWKRMGWACSQLLTHLLLCVAVCTDVPVGRFLSVLQIARLVRLQLRPRKLLGGTTTQ